MESSKNILHTYNIYVLEKLAVFFFKILTWKVSIRVAEWSDRGFFLSLKKKSVDFRIFLHIPRMAPGKKKLVIFIVWIIKNHVEIFF